MSEKQFEEVNEGQERDKNQTLVILQKRGLEVMERQHKEQLREAKIAKRIEFALLIFLVVTMILLALVSR